MAPNYLLGTIWHDLYVKGPLFFQFNQLLDSRAEIHQILELFLGKFKASKNNYEINWPLDFRFDE